MAAAMQHSSKRARVTAAFTALALAIGASVALVWLSSSARAAEEYYPVPSDGVWTIDGRGYGHGRGMSQWGAQGAALSGLASAQIVEFYYPGTTRTAIGNPLLKVQLTATASSSLRVEPTSGLDLTITDEASALSKTVASANYRVVTSGSKQTLQVLNGSTWTAFSLGGSGSYDGPVVFRTSDGITVFATNGTARNYRGEIKVVRTASDSSTAVNHVLMEDYLKGVVPRESPSWFEPAALEAQAIAARSYSHWDARTPSAAAWDICDTTACQVYGGRSLRSSADEPWQMLERDSTNTAIAATAGTALYYDGAPAFTQFSSSNGGVSSAGSQPYLARFADPYDGVDGRNGNHRWTTTLSAAYLQDRYPAVGTLRGMRVLSREGMGEWGGYITSMELVGTSATIKVGARLNLKSTWWQPRDGNAPVGYVDSLTVDQQTVSLAGWTYDPNEPTKVLQVHVYVDGVGKAVWSAGQNRPDVGAAFPEAGSAHGFSGSLTLTPGPHTVCVYGINVGPGSNTTLNCRTLLIEDPAVHNPKGSLDAVTASGATVSVRGWTFDPDVPTAPVTVHVYVDGRPAAGLTANRSRPDVGRAYPAAGDAHGYSWTTTLNSGSHSVCVYAINQQAGTGNPRLGCRTLTVDASRSNPVGSLDAVTATGATVTARGWTFDPDVPTVPVTVHVYVDGRAVTGVVANGSRPDVGRAFPAAGSAHGYSWSGTLSAGSHRVCVYAINQQGGTGNPGLGCRTVTVDASQHNPVGSLDAVTASGTTVTARGWTFDPDVPTTAVQVHVYVDGRAVAALTANQSRPDVGRAYPAAGDTHGYSWSGTLSAGSRTVCVYAINQQAGTGNTNLGCRAVTVG
jgi:SpoIID/LytB domain protein